MLTQDYEERVYAGVLGKIVGVYLGRPFEGWSNRRIEDELGEIDYYVHDKVGVPLIVTDDDDQRHLHVRPRPRGLRLRPRPDPGADRPDLAQLPHREPYGALVGRPRQLHRAHRLPAAARRHPRTPLRLHGHERPGRGRTDRRADLHRRLGDGVPRGPGARRGLRPPGGQRLPRRRKRCTARRSSRRWRRQAFVEDDIDRLIDTGVALVPGNSVLYGMISDIRDWHAKHGDDWRATFAEIKDRYGYDRYGGNCHMVPNHGLIIHALLHGGGDFRESMKIVNTSGWDTDCNSGNLGCLLGIRGGIDGSRGRRLARSGRGHLLPPERRQRPWHQRRGGEARRITPWGIASRTRPTRRRRTGAVSLQLPGLGTRVPGPRLPGAPGAGSGWDVLPHHPFQRPRGWRDRARHDRDVRRIAGDRPVLRAPRLRLMASPTLNPGQTVQASVALRADAEDTVRTALCIRVYDDADELVTLRAPTTDLEPGASAELAWRVPDTAVIRSLPWACRSCTRRPGARCFSTALRGAARPRSRSAGLAARCGTGPG